MAKGAIEVVGLPDLVRDFKSMDKALAKETTKRLKKAAQPAADAAQVRALGRIRNMPASPRWAGMRIGVSRGAGEVYMVPKAKKRSGGSGRTNLKDLLLEQAMMPAVMEKAADIEDALGDMVDDLANSHGF